MVLDRCGVAGLWVFTLNWFEFYRSVDYDVLLGYGCYSWVNYCVVW